MRTISLSHETEIDAPAEQAWEILADYVRDPEWRTGVTSMVPTPAGPVRADTTTVELLRLAGRTWRNHGAVTAVDPGSSFSWRTTDGADACGSRTVRPVGAHRCRVRLELNVTPHGIERLVAPLLARMLHRNLRRDLDQLGNLLAGVAIGDHAAVGS